MANTSQPIVLHDSWSLPDQRPERKRRAKFRRGHVSRHDVLWADVEPALQTPLRPWDRPVSRPARTRTHGRAAQRRGRSTR
jgi:hypothetical protein